MTEPLIHVLALTLRVLIVGGIILILPRINRKGLLFGSYVGESMADREAAARLMRSWYVSCVVLMVLSLVVGYGISLAGQPLAGNLTGTAFLLLGALGLYIRFHFRAREFAPAAAARQSQKAVAVLDVGAPKGTALAKLVLAICVAASLGSFAYAIIGWEATAGKSFLTVMFVPSLNLVLTPFLALLALLTASAKLSVRGGAGGRSAEAQAAFRTAFTSVTTWMALLACAFMTLLTVQITRIERSGIGSLIITILVGAGIIVVFVSVSLFRIMKEYGQGGALRETGSVDAPLTDGLADDARWVWGMFYVNRNDPSLMVEKRFGLGYTFNWGNRTAVLIAASFIVLALGVTAIVLIGASAQGG